MEIKYIEPAQIEKRSFEIISQTIIERYGSTGLSLSEEKILKRVIHTTADFDYVHNLKISDGAVQSARDALMSGCGIVTDTKMALSGINKKILEGFGCGVSCYIGDEDVAREAKQRGITRSAVSMEKAAEHKNNKIFAIGNAPTALITLYDLVKRGEAAPSLIIGVPVGFVNVVESKELIASLDIPYILAMGNKGGSNVAAAIVNAIMYDMKGH